MQHDRWLHWKIQHGLATRGRVGGRMHPKTIIGGLLYKFYYRKFDTPSEGPQVFEQSVGGSVGPVGKTNGE